MSLKMCSVGCAVLLMLNLNCVSHYIESFEPIGRGSKIDKWLCITDILNISSCPPIQTGYTCQKTQGNMVPGVFPICLLLNVLWRIIVRTRTASRLCQRFIEISYQIMTVLTTLKHTF